MTARSASWSASVTRSIALVLRVINAAQAPQMDKARRARGAERHLLEFDGLGTGLVRIANGRYFNRGGIIRARCAGE